MSESKSTRSQINIRDENGELSALIEDMRRWAGFPTPTISDVIRDALRSEHARQTKKREPRS